ncbi:MAG TPA: PAS domain S-box protein, partial [Bacteroidota bacterium]
MTLRDTLPRKKTGRRNDLFTAEIRLRTLEAVGELRSDGIPLVRLLRQLAGAVRKGTGSSFVFVKASDAPGRALSPPVVTVTSPARAGPPPDEPFLLSGVRAGRVHIITPGSRGKVPRRVRTLGLVNLVVLPLCVGRRLRGVLALGSRTRPVTGRGDLRFLRQLAFQAGALLARREERAFLREAAEKYRSLRLGMPDTLILLDPADGKIIDVNPQATRLTGFSRGQLIGKTVFGLHTPLVAEKHRIALKRVRHAFTQYGPIEFLRSKGKPVSAEINARLLVLGGRDMVLCIVCDVSEQKRTEVKLAASEELLRIIVEGTLDMFFYVHDTAGVFTYLSPSVGKITGFPPEHWNSRYKDFLTTNPINDSVREYADRALAEGIPAPTYTCEVRHADGRPLLLEINEKPILKEGRVIGIQGVARDITERKRLEEAILESRDNLNRILDQTPLAVTVLDAAGNLIDVNEAWLRLFGAAARDLVIGKLNVFHSEFIRGTGLAEGFAAVFKGETVDL